MFDAATVALMNSAPELEGLSQAALPKALTKAFATIVAARMRLRSVQDRGGVPLAAQVDEEISMLRRLAFAQEALISVAPDRDERRGGAFVAGTAHYVVHQAERLLPAEEPTQLLQMDCIASEVSATLLFLIAGASADAAEMARAIVIDEDGDDEISAVPKLGDDSTDMARDGKTERRLLRDIQRLAEGELAAIVAEGELEASSLKVLSAAQSAASTLYLMLHRGIQLLARQMLGEPTESPVEYFTRIEKLCSRKLFALQSGQGVLSVYSGPRHLAALLKAVARDLPASGLASLPPPKGISDGPWSRGIKAIAARRPYLWSNHLDAIGRGYLDAGVSSVVSFPTGAGKSTLSELKILTTLTRGLKTVFLAPTLALVDQTARALKSTFPNAELQRERTDDSPFNFDDSGLPAISVMTPERCLISIGFNPEAFKDVGLLVFDECHLLHPKYADRSRRSLDAMLCILNMTALAPAADLLLLSAMMSNAEQISEWVADLTSRPCVPLSMNWKPTRQVRGCIVYGTSEIDSLQTKLRTSKRANPTKKGAPAALKREMLARPFGFLCLNQTWQTVQREDYALLPVLNSEVLLAVGAASRSNWYLTPNANKVAAALTEASSGTASGRPGLKTLVFAQTIPNAQSTADEIDSRLGNANITLTQEESHLYKMALEEVGANTVLYLASLDGLKLTSSCLSHHGLLLPAERHLHESLFRRADGVQALVATSTLAQGMNLPSHVVIIAGDSRFDPSANQMEQMQAHELLNAAGRAGRAGESAYGFVLVIPSKVVSFDDSKGEIHGYWAQLQAIFSQSDQCLAVEDPLQAVLDRIHVYGMEAGDDADYLLRRLPIGVDDADLDGPARTLLSRTMGAFLRRKANDQDWLASRTEKVLAIRSASAERINPVDWADTLAASIGVEPTLLRELKARLIEVACERSVPAWVNWVYEWLLASPQHVSALIRRETVEGLLGKDYRAIEEFTDQGLHALAALWPMLRLWMDGKTLLEMEVASGVALAKAGHCEKSREFVLRLVPELAYVLSLPELVRRTCGLDSLASAELEALGACAREGFNTPEKLAFQRVRRATHSRVGAHRDWRDIEFWIDPAVPGESWSDVYKRVKAGVEFYDN